MSVKFVNQRVILVHCVSNMSIELIRIPLKRTCINSGIQTQDYILPIMNITAKRGRNKYQFNCLIDTGSQRSYLSPQVIEKLNINLSEYSSLYYEASTLLGAKKKELKQMVLDIDYPPGKTVPLPILVDEDFNLKFNVSDFPNVISNIKTLVSN